MRNVLYISNIEVPYRTEYFNQLSKKLNLTVLYERKKSSNRNSTWTSSVQSNYDIEYLKGIKMFKEYTFDFKIFKYILSKKYDDIIFGCYNSPSQIIAILLMRILRKKYIINLDGEYFFEGKGIKKILKRFFVRGADKYFIAGEHPKKNLEKFIKNKNIFVYHFSSLTNAELKKNSENINKNVNNCVLVVGQYFDYKGLDIALEVARLNQNIKYKFIGSSKRSELLAEKVNELKLLNVEVIPFLKKEDLYNEYQQCKCVLLPSRKECWGLVINEAASFACPIISTNGSGAAMELLEEQWIANSGDVDMLYKKILDLDNIEYDKEFLLKKVSKYSIENTVKETIEMLEDNK